MASPVPRLRCWSTKRPTTNAILETTAALDQRRADLDELGKLLTNEAHRLNGHPPRLPPQISRALYPADRALVGTANAISATDWRRVYQALIEDPGEHEIGPVSDSVEVEAS